MSRDRRELKLMAICLMTFGIAVPAFEIIFSLAGKAEGTATFRGLVGVVAVVSLVCGFLGVQAANSPAKTQPFIVSAVVAIVVGVAFTAFWQLSTGVYNPDYYLGAIVAVFAGVGLHYGLRVRKRHLKRKQ